MTDLALYINNFSKNLKYLRRKLNISQNTLATALNMTQAAISQYEKKESVPTLKNIIDICEVFRIKIDDMINFELNEYNFNNFIYDLSIYTNLQPKENFPEIQNMTKNMSRFENNTYYCYYYNSDDKKNNFKSGILHVGSVENPKYIDVTAQFSDYDYTGNMTIVHDYIYLILENSEREEKCFIIVPYRYTPKKYVGGLGCILSISTGYNIKPCYQHILISDIEIAESIGNLRDIFNIYSNQTKIFFNAELDNAAYYAIQNIKTLRGK